MHRICLLALLATLGPRLYPAAQTAPAAIGAAGIRAPEPNHHWPDFETYHYEAEWRLWTAGLATLRLQPGPNGQKQVLGTALSTGFVSLLYTVRDRFESAFDAKTFCSSHLAKYTEEGFRKRETRIQFDYARGKAVLDEKNLKSNESKHVENDIPSCATDVLSGIYYLASLPLQTGSIYSFPLNDGNRTQTVEASVEAREQVKVPAGTFRAVRVQLVASPATAQTKPGKVWIWYSDDAARIPVQMRARMFWGTLTLRLKRIERTQETAPPR